MNEAQNDVPVNKWVTPLLWQHDSSVEWEWKVRQRCKTPWEHLSPLTNNLRGGGGSIATSGHGITRGSSDGRFKIPVSNCKQARPRGGSSSTSCTGEEPSFNQTSRSCQGRVVFQLRALWLCSSWRSEGTPCVWRRKAGQCQPPIMRHFSGCRCDDPSPYTHTHIHTRLTHFTVSFIFNCWQRWQNNVCL